MKAVDHFQEGEEFPTLNNPLYRQDLVAGGGIRSAKGGLEERPLSIERVSTELPEWDEYVESHPGSTSYHRYAWKKVIEKSFAHPAYFLLARNDSGAVCGILPMVHMKSPIFGNFLVSLPFFNYGGLLCDDDQVERALLREVGKIRRSLSADFVELRSFGRDPGGLPTRTNKVTMILNLEKDEDTQWKALNAKVRNQVRKAEKNGMQVRIGGGELLEGFYEVFCRNMRDLGTPVYGKVFFHNILSVFEDSSRIISVVYQGRTVASAIAIWYRGTLEVPWASSIKEFKSLCPNNLLYWEAIRLAIQQGARRFDFGRSTPEGGTYQFKKQWGAKPKQLFWQYLMDERQMLPELNPANPRYRMAIKVWQRLPVSLTKLIGPQIVRCIP